mmetsp:Transcript_49223/g.110816  ORF Transcript_49223/g.110816 Transcript_49223/m.110816 type:complete len:355 (+) Transcript_49223:328-1392(+)
MHDGVNVDAPGLALEPQAAVQELTNVHVPGAIVVDELEEPLRVVGVQAKRSEVALYTGVLQVLVDLAETNRPGAVLVHLHEQVTHLMRVLLFELQLLLYEEVALRPRGLHRVVDKDSRDDVHHRQHGECDVEEEQEAHHPVDVQERVAADAPAHAAEHGLHKAVDCPAEGPKLPFNLRQRGRALLGMLLNVLRGRRGETNGEDVDDDGKHQECPHQRSHGVHDHQRQKAEFPEEPEHAEDPHDSQHLDDLHAGRNGRPSAAAHSLNDEVHNGEKHEKHVEDVPAPVLVREVLSALQGQSQDHLDDEEDAAHVAGYLLVRSFLGICCHVLDLQPDDRRIEEDHERARGVKQGVIH